MEPDFSKPVDVQAYFYNAFGACGCSELDAMIVVVRHLLRWIESDGEDYDALFDGNTGVYYLLTGIMDKENLCEHGVSIRVPWLTDKGRELLKAIDTFTAEEIEQSSGVAYDGLDYGEG